MRYASILTALALLLVGACGATFRPFAARAVMWRDEDRRPFSPRPAVQYDAWGWETVDNTLFRQTSRALAYERSSEAIDVNSMDEVPDSSWYTNRLSRSDMTLDALRQGACPDLAPPPPPYVVVHGKFTGSSPGAVVRAADGHQYLLKVDFDVPERATAADAIATRFVYAAGYETACNRVVYVRADELGIGPHATKSAHSHDPYTQEDLAKLMREAGAGPNGTRRMSMSLYLEGTLLGGFRFAGVRGDDPNDVVPHDQRRELRGFYVLSAWMNHVDARVENNVDTWVDTGHGRGFVRHVILDAGDSFGIVWSADVDDGEARRFGNAHYFDVEQITGDFFTLGLADRAYRGARRGPAFEFLGWYDVERFDPSAWRNGYPNPAFEKRTEADCAWMARIVSRFDETKVRAVVESGRISRPLWTEELVRILMGRRARILDRYLLHLSPLAFPEVVGGHRLCVRDLAVESGARLVEDRRYGARHYVGVPPRPVSDLVVLSVDERLCVDLPATPAAQAPSYHVVDLFSSTDTRESSHPARLHLWQDANGAYVLAGLERPDGDGPP